MLICFIGPPCSGKTTTAALLFAKLKEGGQLVEFVTEYARRYIAGLQASTLNDSDQISIMRGQHHDENLMLKSIEPDGWVITDSSVINTLLYLKGVDQELEQQAKESIKRYDVAFWCHPVEPPKSLVDPNRIHTFDQSVELDLKLEKVLFQYAPNLKVVHLAGVTNRRVAHAINSLLEMQQHDIDHQA
jgi:tRNA uridine 5-carbamoylmethylation protein Kti12